MHGVLPEAFTGDLEQLWPHRQIAERALDIRMPHKGRKMRQLRLGIDTLSIPRKHSVAHHRMA
jgi:hypothetical protein